MTTVSSASVAVGCRRLSLEEHPDPGREREPVRAAGHQKEGVQENTGCGKFKQFSFGMIPWYYFNCRKSEIE